MKVYDGKLLLVWNCWSHCYSATLDCQFYNFLLISSVQRLLANKVAIDLMHWRHKGSHLHNNDARLVLRSAHVLCWQCALALSLSVRGPRRASPAVWHAGVAPLAACLAMTHVAVPRFDPQRRWGALLWRHMHIWSIKRKSGLHFCFLFLNRKVLSSKTFTVF